MNITCFRFQIFQISESNVGGGGGAGHWGLFEAEKPLKLYAKTEKPQQKITQNRNTAEHNDQNSKFTLDTTTKYSYTYVRNGPVLNVNLNEI